MSARTLLTVLALLAVPVSARGLTVNEIIALSRSGVADVVLTALIDADRTIFTLTAGQILELRDAGVSEAVVLKMLGSRKEFETPPPIAEAAAPQASAASETEGTASPQEAPLVMVPYYIWYPVYIDTRGAHHDRHHGDHAGHDDRHHARPDKERAPGKRLPLGTIRDGDFVR
jgi:hypothetical protein